VSAPEDLMSPSRAPGPGTLAYAAQCEQEWAAYWDRELARQRRKIRLEAARECGQCHGTTVGSRIGWMCGTCRMSRS